MPSEQITSAAYTVGTATTPVVGMSADAQIAYIQNLEPTSVSAEYAKAGYAYLLQREFTVNSPGTAIFKVETGTRGLQIDFYEIVSTVDNVKGELIESPTIGTTGAAIPAYNLNRNYSDAHDTVFTAGTSITGGTVIAAEYITADKHAASGGGASAKIYTLKPSTTYGFKFVNKGNQNTTVFFQMSFAEKFNGWNDVWLGGGVDAGVRLRGGQVMQLPMIQGQTLSAVASDDVQVGVLRQD